MNWSLPQKITFTFVSIYLFLFCMSNQFILSFLFDQAWRIVVPWFAEQFLDLPEKITVFTNGSGDTTYNYVSLLVYAVLAGLLTIIWMAIDPKKMDYDKALDVMVVVLRYYVIFQMFNYGMAKLYYLQFRPPSFARLIQPYGDSSPMGLLWTFMGFSKGYTMFTGVGELVGAIFLLIRRTRTLGALAVFAVMSNVMALNFFYDVPVKILSSHLVLISLLLIALDWKRLLNVFILNKPVETLEIRPLLPIKDKTVINILMGVKWTIVALVVGLSIFQMSMMSKRYGPQAEKPYLYGLYEIEQFMRNGESIEPLPDENRWKHLIYERKNAARVEDMQGELIRYVFKPDSASKTIALHLQSDTTTVDTLYFSFPDSNRVQLTGVLAGDSLNVLMKSRPQSDFLLMNRGFRWINEYPFNR